MPNNNDTISGGNGDIVDPVEAEIAAWHATMAAIPAFVLIDHYQGRTDVARILKLTAQRRAMEATLTNFNADLEAILADSKAACAVGGDIDNAFDQALFPDIYSKLLEGVGLGGTNVPTLDGMKAAVEACIVALTPVAEDTLSGANGDTLGGA